MSHDWHQVTSEDECFFLRVYAPGDYRFKGADLGILVTKGRMQTADGLTGRVSALHRRHPFPVRQRASREASGRYARRVREVSTRSLHSESVTTARGTLSRLVGLIVRQRENAEARLAARTVNTQFSWGSDNAST